VLIFVFFYFDPSGALTVLIRSYHIHGSGSCLLFGRLQTVWDRLLLFLLLAVSLLCQTVICEPEPAALDSLTLLTLDLGTWATVCIEGSFKHGTDCVFFPTVGGCFC